VVRLVYLELCPHFLSDQFFQPFACHDTVDFLVFDEQKAGAPDHPD
jgi:hypothetical protein